ncbi:MAG: hypothetical protein LBL07_03790 [Tannerella sp.]|jgi:hypothetical protein|nr:hypothetical protein [Tannerella sp.]
MEKVEMTNREIIDELISKRALTELNTLNKELVKSYEAMEELSNKAQALTAEFDKLDKSSSKLIEASATKAVNSVLCGIIEGVKQARQETAKDGALIAPGNRPVEINFNLSIIPGVSGVTFKIPLVIPVQQATVKTDENPPLPVTPDTKIRDTGLSMRVKNGLTYRDIETVRDLLAIKDLEELLTCHNIGHVSLQEIKTFLTGNGFYTEPAGDFVNLENTQNIKIKL